MATLLLRPDFREDVFKGNHVLYPPQDTLAIQPFSTPEIPQQQTNNFSTHHGVERKLGETELSYFLPSREDGVNDMYLHLGCRVPLRLVERRRVLVVWTIMRIRHPLLASNIKLNGRHDVAFTYNAPHSPNEALELAGRHLEYRNQCKDDLINTYLNGTRTLSNKCLSYLIVSRSEGGDSNVDFLICATHFIGDGMALHQFANDFFALLGSALDQDALNKHLADEWFVRCCPVGNANSSLPSSMEDRFPVCQPGRLENIVSRIDFELSQQKLIGGHQFPKQAKGIRNTVIPTISIDPHKTKIILKNCKDHGVSISATILALCNVAWARTRFVGLEIPIMMYSAMNMRSKLLADKRLNDSYWFLAIGYFNVVLPAFFPKFDDRQKQARIFWHRVHAAKAQTAHAAKNPMVISRCRQMALERGKRARAWAKEDDRPSRLGKTAPSISTPPRAPFRPIVPSTALMGLSLLGNLDNIYKHADFPDFKFHTLSTGSRQRVGGMLLFAYTFAGKLWISFGYDENGFEDATVKNFWKNILDGIKEFMLAE